MHVPFVIEATPTRTSAAVRVARGRGLVCFLLIMNMDTMYQDLTSPAEANRSVPLISGVNHIAILTANLERFIDFYVHVIGLELVFHEDTPSFCHAILRSGTSSWLHPVEAPGNRNGGAVEKMFERGHLDHFALAAASRPAFNELRARLVACGASDGSVEDLGAFHAIWFKDPDGMRVELSLVVDPLLSRFHTPTRRPAVTADAALSLERLTTAQEAAPVDPLLREYVPWVAQLLMSKCGVQIDDIDGFAERHHAAFRTTLADLLGGRGRLLLARLDGTPAGVVALKPVDRCVAEVKRMYVQPDRRGLGIARALAGALHGRRPRGGLSSTAARDPGRHGRSAGSVPVAWAHGDGGIRRFRSGLGGPRGTCPLHGAAFVAAAYDLNSAASRLAFRRCRG